MKTNRKEDILRKTFTLLLTNGYDNVSITDIQNVTGMSRGLLYHYYGNKEELFRIAGETFLKNLLMIDTESTKDYSIIEMIDYIINRYRDIYKEWGNSSSKVTITNYDFLVYRMIEKDEYIANIYNDIRAKESEAWKRAAWVSMKEREIHSILSEEKIASHFIALMDGSWMEAVTNDNVEQYIKRTKQVLIDYYELLKVRN